MKRRRFKLKQRIRDRIISTKLLNTQNTLIKDLAETIRELNYSLRELIQVMVKKE